MNEYIDSFGVYVPISVSTAASQASLLTFWNALGGGDPNIGIYTGTGSRGNPALYIPFGDEISKTISHQATYTSGMRVKVSGSGANVGGGDLHTFLNNGIILATLRVNNDGTMLLYAGGSLSNIVALSTSALLQSTYYYIEWTFTLTGTTNINVAGQIWVNGISVASGNANSGVNNNTLISGTTTVNRSMLGAGVSTPGGAYFTDLYVNNGSGTTNLSIFGDVEIEPLLPNADGGTLQWTPLSGSTHYLMIDENPADGDASYNSDNTPGNYDIYGWQPIPTFTGTVKTVQIRWYARKDDEGTRTFRGNIGTTGTEETTTTYSLSDSYLYYTQSFDTDPATSLAWTQANFNAKKFGIELIA